MRSTQFKDALAASQAYKQLSAGEFTAAKSLAEQALKSNPREIWATHIRGVVAFHGGDYRRAEKCLKQCVQRVPKDPSYRCDLAQIYALQRRDEKAIECYDRVLKRDPRHIRARSGKADVLERTGRIAAAKAVVGSEFEVGTDDDGFAVVIVRLLVRDGRVEEASALAEKLLARPPRDLQSRRQLCLQIGRVHDKQGNYEKAFQAFKAANSLHDVRFNPTTYEESIDELIRTFSAENLRKLPRARHTSELPIFIACMPRSGSTLVEQIIHAHSRAFGAGEIDDLAEMIRDLPEHIESPQLYPACIGDLTAEKLDRLSDDYLRAIRQMARGVDRIANKHLVNYRHLGMISLMFPEARIVHTIRDRVDNGLACYMAALSPDQAPWVTKLDHIGFAWRQYERLMDHWREVLDRPILDVRYEELVDDTEDQIRRLIDFCGLPWDDKCLRYWEADRKVLTLSYDQVNKPIFKSAVKRWKNYEQFLGPLKAALEGDTAGSELSESQA